MSKVIAKKDFKFKDLSTLEVVEIINKDLAINIASNESLLERVSMKYPYIEKYKIALIMKIFFDELRSSLILGKRLTISPILNNVRLYIFHKNGNGCKIPFFKIRNNTNKKLSK
jgi:hypothetical protein